MNFNWIKADQTLKTTDQHTNSLIVGVLLFLYIIFSFCMIMWDSMAHLRKLKQLFLERMELPEDVRKLIENDMILDPMQRLGSDDSMTEKTIDLDEGTGVPGVFEEEKEKRLEDMKKKGEGK